LFGLVACTGLRISEALGLLDADVDLSVGVLTIRQSKFGKTRLVPLHPSAVQALERYRLQRAPCAHPPELPFFVASRGQLAGAARRGSPGPPSLRSSAPGTGLGRSWQPRQAAHPRPAPQLRRAPVGAWHEQGENINQRMLALSTYLGHVKVSSTYWYLTGVPELMGLLGQAFERYASPWEDGDEYGRPPRVRRRASPRWCSRSSPSTSRSSAR
jgi:integrase